MVKKTKKDIHSEEAGLQERREEEAGVAQEARCPEDLVQKLQQKEKEAAENYDKYVRAAAELENYKKRAAREKADAIKYGNELLLRDILPFTDGLDRALEHAGNSSDFESFKQGLTLLQEQLLCSLQKHGVEQIECANQDFDPNIHEAMLQMESDEHEDNKIIKEFEKGYLLNGRLLRPSRVCICKKARQQDCEKPTDNDRF